MTTEQITIPRATFDAMREALDLALPYVERTDATIKVEAAIAAANALDHFAEARNMVQPQKNSYQLAVDEALVSAHLGVTFETDDYATAKKKLNDLIGWSIQVERDLSQPQARGELPPISPNDHPEPHTYKWSDLELRAIQDYARAAIAAHLAAPAIKESLTVPEGWRHYE